MDIPGILIKNVIHVHGEKGRQWLNDLPNLLEQFAKSWNLRLDDCYANANFNYVAPAKLENDLEMVLKCGVPGQQLTTEAKVLHHFNGVGAVRLLKFDEAAGVMLLEKIIDEKLLRYRLDQFIEVSGFDQQRIVGWLFSKAILAAWWDI